MCPIVICSKAKWDWTEEDQIILKEIIRDINHNEHLSNFEFGPVKIQWNASYKGRAIKLKQTKIC